MKSSREFVQCLVVLLLGLPGATLAQDRPFTFFVTSDSHYEAIEKAERNDRNRLTIARMNELPGTDWPEKLGGGKISQPRGVLVLGDLIDDGDKAGETEIEWRASVEQFGFDGGDGLLKYPVFEGWGNRTWKFLPERSIERPLAQPAGSALPGIDATSVAALETVKLAVGKKGFVLHPSGKRYVPWGHNYASVDILERLTKDPERVEREFAEMKAAGTTVARIHPELPRILRGPAEVDAKGVDSIKQLLQIAEKTGIHLKITGLANYRIKDRVAWYDRLPEPDRWQAQAFFWETVARACAESPAVFAYDLVNEPGAVGKPEDGWYFGRMGEVEFCQRLSLNPGERKGEEIFRAWTRLMVAAIRKHDNSHLTTMGMLPFPGSYKAVAEELDFVSPHLYPKSGKVAEEIALLKNFDWGKPIVIGETFPLSCSKDEEREFLLKSREFAHGWIGHWPDESPAELAELKKTGKATIANAIWLSWVELFKELGPQMIAEK